MKLSKNQVAWPPIQHIYWCVQKPMKCSSQLAITCCMHSSQRNVTVLPPYTYLNCEHSSSIWWLAGSKLTTGWLSVLAPGIAHPITRHTQTLLAATKHAYLCTALSFHHLFSTLYSTWWRLAGCSLLSSRTCSFRIWCLAGPGITLSSDATQYLP